MLFTGNHLCTIDQKQRLAIPAKFRNLLARAAHRDGPGADFGSTPASSRHDDAARARPAPDRRQGRAGTSTGKSEQDESGQGHAASQPALAPIEWFCVPWPNGSLRLYTAHDFERLAARRDPSLMPASHEAELEADFFGFTERVDTDSAGRITLPASVLGLVNLKKGDDVAVVGAGVRIEVWPAHVYAATLAQRFQRLALHADSAARTSPPPAPLALPTFPPPQPPFPPSHLST